MIAVDPKYLVMLGLVFKVARLPEITEIQRPPGSYTNAQLIEKMAAYPYDLVRLLMRVPKGNSESFNRKLLSAEVDFFLGGKIV